MIVRLEKEKEERGNRRKRAKIEATEAKESEILQGDEVEKESTIVSPSEIQCASSKAETAEEVESETSISQSKIECATSNAETSAAAGESLKCSNDDPNLKSEPKEDVEADESSSEATSKPKVVDLTEDSSTADEKTEEEDYEVEKIVDYSWCRETVSELCTILFQAGKWSG